MPNSTVSYPFPPWEDESSNFRTESKSREIFAGIAVLGMDSFTYDSAKQIGITIEFGYELTYEFLQCGPTGCTIHFGEVKLIESCVLVYGGHDRTLVLTSTKGSVHPDGPPCMLWQYFVINPPD